ncbi:MAG: DUF427 domain-containing protein [Acidimicrobiia bacterium]
MTRAVLADAVLAESDRVRVVEGNVYFPSEDVDRRYLIESDTHSWCYWKGRASYYHVRAGDLFLTDAAWCYPKAWPLARWLRGYVAFSSGIEIRP